MNVLSLFDGMSCGRLALDRAGIEYDKYYASEIDKHAIKVTMANYPNTIQLGDINKWREWAIDWSRVDLILAGSPCQGFSFAGKQLNFDDPRSKLFFVFLDILNHVKAANPKVKFLLENVVMKKEYQEIITEKIGVEPVLINSALVSAQNRKRLYWANWHFEQPQDKGILLKDIVLENEKTETFLILQKRRGNNPGGIRAIDGKTPCMTANSWQDNNHLVFKPATMLPNKSHTDGGQVATASEIKGYDLMKRVYGLGGKSPTLNACTGGNREPKIAIAADGESVMYRKLTPLECERLQTLPEGYTNHVSNTQRYKAIGNGWTVDVIAHILMEGFKLEND